MGRATLADVARLAGVSGSTASVVFSGKVQVSDEARDRVLAAAAELGYAGPDPRAASLRRGRSGIVGVVFGSALRVAFADPGIIATMDGLAEGVAGIGAGLLLLRDDAGTPVDEAPVDGVVFFGSRGRSRDRVDRLHARGVPVVSLEGALGDDVVHISLDNREAEQGLARHLRSLGHTSAAVVTLPWGTHAGDPATEEPPLAVTRERLRGVRDVFPDAVACPAADSSIDAGHVAARALLAGPDRPTAIIAQSDLLAGGVIRAAEEAGLRVPEDLSVTGFDGIRVDGLGDYELTTMVQPSFEKGRAAGEAVARLLQGQPTPSISFTSTFREGNTTAPPRNAELLGKRR